MVESEIARRFANSYRVVYTEHPLHAMELTREQLKRGAQTVVAVGGDGTINEVVNGFFEKGELVSKDAALAVLCFGTGGDFVRTINWPTDYRQALNRLAQGNKSRIDVGRGEFCDLKGQKQMRYFINIAEYGCGGVVVYRVNRISKFWGGKISFMWAIVTTLLSYQNQTIHFQCEHGPWQTEKLNNTIVANGRFFGSGLKPAPEAKLDDGKLDVVTFGDVSLWESINALPLLRRGEHLSNPKVHSYRTQVISATSEEDVLIDMDGEMVGRLPASFEILPQILYLCT